MLEFAKKYPQYSFDLHKGYGTQKHILALQQFGVLKEHRKTFAPVKKMGLSNIVN